MRPLKSLRFLVAVVSVAWLSGPASAQVLTINPTCGKPGSQVQIGGSGWAEPQPVCEYHFLFDGAQFAPIQPDGLFGPPNQTGTIPAGATTGDHKIKVELRLTSDQSLLQCRQRTFKVVANDDDPWKDNGGGVKLGSATDSDFGCQTTAGAPNNTRIVITFSPKNVCDVSPCTKLAFIQVVKRTGTKADATTRQLTYSEEDACWQDAAKKDKDITAAHVKIDRAAVNAPVPYYGLPNGCATSGFSGTPTGDQNASMEDSPSMTDDCYPADIVKKTLDFETAVFCAEGDDKGKYFGKVAWHWTRNKGRKFADGTEDPTGTITADAPTRAQPSQDLIDALNLWAAPAPTGNGRNFTVPTSTAPTTSGEACQ